MRRFKAWLSIASDPWEEGRPGRHAISWLPKQKNLLVAQKRMGSLLRQPATAKPPMAWMTCRPYLYARAKHFCLEYPYQFLHSRGVRFSGSLDLLDCGFSIKPASIKNTTEEMGFGWECYFTHLPTIDEEEMWSTHKKIRRIILVRFDQ